MWEKRCRKKSVKRFVTILECTKIFIPHSQVTLLNKKSSPFRATIINYTTYAFIFLITCFSSARWENK